MTTQTGTRDGRGSAEPQQFRLNPVVADFLERAGWSAGQVFFATLTAGGTAVTVANLPWGHAAVLAFSAAVASLVLTAVQYLGRLTDLPFWPDMLIRLAKTFLASLAASFAADSHFDVTRFHWTAALNLAGVAVLTALGKGLLARGGDAGPAGQTQAGTRPAANPSTLPTRTYLAAVTSRTRTA